MRELRGPDGALWTVWDVHPSLSRATRVQSLAHGLSDGWLCFESGGKKFRLAGVPDAWHLLSDDERHGLRERAVPASPRRTP